MDKVIDFHTIRKRSMQANKEAINALNIVKNFCANQSREDCDIGRCILFKWCKGTGNRLEYPCNWQIPE